ncbi:MAG: hypothetical protein AB7S54_12620, partial [Bacteroidales bacterium]
MKKIYFLLAALLLGTFASWAQDLSFTIFPETSGTFQIYYSTYNAPSGSCVFVDWGDGRYNYPEAETGSDPSKLISGTVTKGKPIYIYSDYIDAIYIVTQSQAILCNGNNPQLQYFYYFKDNLSPQNLEAFYLSLKDRVGKDLGELHLSNKASISLAGENILKSNAFIPLSKNWSVCSKKAWTGSSSARIYWELNEANCKSNLIPAIEITTPSTANIELQLGMTPDSSLPWYSITSKVRIIDGNNNNTSEFIYRYTTESDFWNNSTKHSLKGGKIKIYGAQVSHLSTSGISSFKLNGTTNMRHLRIVNSSDLTYISRLSDLNLLESIYLKNTGLSSISVTTNPNLHKLNVSSNPKLQFLYFDRTNLEMLVVDECPKLQYGNLSTIEDAKKLVHISVKGMGWDACTLDEIYGYLPPAPSGAQIYVEDICEPNDFNDWEESNKTIATNKGWKVMLEYNCGAEKQLTGDGGGCKPIQYTNIPDNNFLQALKDLGYGTGAVGNEIPTANLSG